MALPINIEDLLKQRKVESNRIEFKKGWNPERVYKTICAFANDFENLGGGYILIGVEEENGIAKRPVLGLDDSALDHIQKQMIDFNHKINPFYLPRTEIDEIDGKNILVIWCPSGNERPYNVPENVLSKDSPRKYYIRSGSSTIEAKGYVLDELRDMANRVPFDDRGNTQIKLSDISPILVLDYLNKVGSKLAKDFNGHNLESILEQMDLFVGPSENRILKNVSAMMFSPNPAIFFPYTQVEVVHFPEGVLNNPNNMKEVPPIQGSVPQIIEETMRYLRTVVINQTILKPKDQAESIKYYNYPYQALEESVSNALYHRDYRSREPIVIEIQPEEITISSTTGPDRSISLDTIKEGKKMVTRFYRNRRLGEFLKELGLTEGRSTGIPTIQDELSKNGSPKATFETDEGRTYFVVHIPIHQAYLNLQSTPSDRTINRTVNDNETLDNKTISENLQNDESDTPRTVNRTVNEILQTLPEFCTILYKEIKKRPNSSYQELAKNLGKGRTTISETVKILKTNGLISREGSPKTGNWIILK